MPQDQVFTSGRGLLLATLLAIVPAATAFAADPLPKSVATPQPAGLHLPAQNKIFVGTCYQPADRTREQVVRDVALMKAAGFRMVRIGDLSWTALEPKPGVFDFTHFDYVVGLMHAAGIEVLFDISGLPAPAWLHSADAGVNVVDEHGATLHAAERYMEDISDPEYRAEVVKLASAVIQHYANNPAIVAFGYDNEIGNGFMSYSEADRKRFIAWLQTRYGTLDALNRAWSTQEWSRQLDQWDEIQLPYSSGPTAPEPYLDLHRFWSDETLASLEEIEAVRRRYAPSIPTASNLWDTASRKGFDYYKGYKDFATFGAEGFYPGDPLDAITGVLLTRGDLTTPTWYNEFVTGDSAGSGGYGGSRGILRMWAYLGLLQGGQTFLAWTFKSHNGGEEQAVFGLLDHDGTPSWKYAEFGTIAREFAQLETIGWPRAYNPQVAVAYSFDSAVASHPPGTSNGSIRKYFRFSYHDQLNGGFAPFFADNIDASIINPAYADLTHYKMVVVPAGYIMDPSSAQALRDYVKNGGTVVMTAFSAKADEHSQWFDTPLPGLLSDVFGLRTSEFYESPAPPSFAFDGQKVQGKMPFYEVLEPRTATVLARFENTAENSPAITMNHFGKGQAFYLATPAESATLAPLVRSLYKQLGIIPGPVTPPGVYARTIAGNTMYVNTNHQTATVLLPHESRGVFSGKIYQKDLPLPALGVEIVQ